MVQGGSGKPRVELRKGGEEHLKKVVAEYPTYIRSLEDTWIQPGATIRIAVTAPRNPVKLSRDRIPGICSLEIGWRGEPTWNQGEKNFYILKTASAEISSQIFQDPECPEGRCLAVSNRSTEPVRVRPGQIVAEAEMSNEGDPDVWTPPRPPEPRELSPRERKEKLWKQLKLEEKEVLVKKPKLMAQVKQLIGDYEDVFKSEDKPFGQTELAVCKLRIKPGVKPVKQPDRPLNPKDRADLRTQLDIWLEQGIIEPSSSPWSSPLVAVRKKDGGTRWAVDFRRVNDCCISDSYPLPRVQETLDKLSGKRIFSTLDAASAYWTIPMEEDSKEYTAFSTPWGLYQFCVMPFGLTSAGAVYSRFVQQVLEEGVAPEDVDAYLDDVVVSTQEEEAHLERLREVLQRHREAGIKLNPTKTVLFEKEVEFLGHRVSEKGISMVPEYVDRILQWPRPTNVVELRRAIGFLNYYRNFIQGFSELAAPLNEKRSLKGDFQWTKSMEDSFQKLKEAFKKGPVRAYPVFKEGGPPFKLTTDFSGTALSAVLSQEQDGVERFIGAAGRKTTVGERNYPSHKGELSAAIMGIRRYEHILKYAPFELYTDSSYLKHLKTLKNPKGILARWLEELQQYSFRVIHKPGRNNVNADALSRSHHLPPASKEEEEEQQLAAVIPQEFNKERVLQAQKEDPDLSLVAQWVRADKIPSKEEIRGKGEELTRWREIAGAVQLDQRGILVLPYSQPGTSVKANRVLVPTSLRENAFYSIHSHRSAGHFGVRASIERANKYIYYPGIRKDVTSRIADCGECLAKDRKHKIRDTTHQPRRASFPFERLYIDLVGPLGDGQAGPRYILTAEDHFTRWVTAVPISNKETQTVARALLDNVIFIYGCPEEIHSDQGKEFTSKLWTELMSNLQINKTMTPAYNPQSNLVERFHRVLGQMMRVLLERDDPTWVKLVRVCVFAYNTKQHTSTGLTPYAALFGREARLPLDLILENPAEKYDSVHEFVKDVLNRTKEVYAYIRRNGEAVIRRNSNLYAGNQEEWEPGTLVWYCSPRSVPGKPDKLVNAWRGPFKVVQRVAEVLVDICPSQTEGKTLRVHVTRLKRYHANPNSVMRGTVDVDLDDLEAEEVRERSSAKVELAVPVYSGGAGIEMQDLPVAVKDAVEEQLPSMPAPAEVSDQLTNGNRDVTQPEARNGPIEESSPDMEVQVEGDSQAVETGSIPVEEEMPAETRAAKRVREPSVPGAEKESGRPMTRRRKWIEAAKKLAASAADSSEEEVAVVRTNQEALVVLERTVHPEAIAVIIRSGSKRPVQQTEGSAGYDLSAATNVELEPGKVTPVPLNLRLAIPAGYYLQLASRSGLASRGLLVTGGVVDSDYRGEVKALILNWGEAPFLVKKGQRIAQGLFIPIRKVNFIQQDELPASVRGDAGFGHTGMH